ncbi:phosphoenolpyruvate synthase [Algoriphagus boseongensis]|uniref:Phosphoenolpyruvate synthase n=1 Tax=Algoriphagus boseongensis TaxID=1442587 RepID=A0A4V3D236_9BACT|nr:phosphoenolpyruvate synthase [Algoriphagus boseongensis]TDQ16623.1 phosphoenolpyruvate synthase [Algoriphagus boseongensis]
MEALIIPFEKIGIEDVPKVGGKNASLGEMYQKLNPLGIRIPNGFAITATAFRLFLEENKIKESIQDELKKLDLESFSNLSQVSSKIKSLILKGQLPEVLTQEIIQHYQEIKGKKGQEVDVAVRSSATAEDLPGASFAGLHESFLNIRGTANLLKAVKSCFASLYNGRAIKYRHDKGYDKHEIALSVGVQRMVRADLASSGVCFSIDPESGFQQAVLITGCWGLGENIVQGAVIPDEFLVFKPSLEKGKRAIISKKAGSKTKTMVYSKKGGTLNLDTPKKKQKELVLNDEEVETLGKWSVQIEKHYGLPMDIEWAKDGKTGELFIVQARPETVHFEKDPYRLKEFILTEKGKVVSTGYAIGSGITSGNVKILKSPTEASKLKEGEILLTEITNPDWDPIMKKAAAIITTKGGRTSHAAIVAREMGALAIVGAEDALDVLKNGDEITLDTSSGKMGKIYRGKLEWKTIEHNFHGLRMPKTHPMFILADPEKAFNLSFFPNQGVGLMRMEFVVNSSIRIHPMALVHFDQLKNKKEKSKIKSLCWGYKDKQEYFVDKLSQAISTIAAAFYPKEVILRMSDFKTNEYANLLGGHQFEAQEENPMLGFRGASRYDHERYREGFELECQAVKRVREDMGLENLKVMIPFCRTPEEGKKVITLMKKLGLVQGKNGLEIYVMAEIPSNVILAKEFAKIFDGFSIGSNDLTQLTLGVDRDSEILSEIFDENNPAVKWMISQVIREAKAAGKKIGLCGQAPSDNPAFAKFLIAEGIDSISFNADALLKGIENMNQAEAKTKSKTNEKTGK